MPVRKKRKKPPKKKSDAIAGKCERERETKEMEEEKIIMPRLKSVIPIHREREWHADVGLLFRRGGAAATRV